MPARRGIMTNSSPKQLSSHSVHHLTEKRAVYRKRVASQEVLPAHAVLRICRPQK